jgi:hypothetical protein
MEITDEKLFQLCRHYGEISLKYRWKFAGLLPEVYKRRLFEKKGFSSIFEFAAKLAGMSEEQVRLVLNLEKRFEDKPVLKTLLVNGEVSVNKLARVASIATIENQEFLAGQAKLLPQAALETLVRDEKSLRAHSNPSQNEQQASEAATDELFLSPEVKEKLFELQQKGIDINQLILEFLQKREMEIAQKKEKLASEAKPTNSRYIKKSTRELLKEEFGTKCSIEWCRKEADEIHHTQRFGMTKNHNPKFLAPLCEEHHAIAHSIDVKIQEKKRM